MWKRTVVGAVLVLAGVSGALAHHSAAMFDMAKTVVITGTVKQFQWTNPHGWLIVTGQAPDGTDVEWSVEMTSPNLLARAGWRPGSIKAGDRITILGYPLRTSNNGAQFKCAVLNDGRVLTYESISPKSTAGDVAAGVAACRAGKGPGAGR